jgi:alpha-beta hydrolase superfamily lysophospholipase
MAQEKQAFFTTPDGVNLYLREWTPGNSPKAVILYIHGLGSHGGRLDHWAERFNEKQVAFLAYDQRGHGRADGRRGGTKHIRQMIGDVQTITGEVHERYPGIPLILYGHSLGGNIALNHVTGSGEMPDGLIISSPWLRLVHPPSKVLLTVAGILNKITPGLTLSNGLNADDISREKSEADKYREDPLVHDKISIGLFFSVVQAGRDAMNNAAGISCPFLLMHGTGDRITSHEASSELAGKSGDNTTLKLWEGAYHELHHEPVREEVFGYIVAWMKQQKLL